MLTRSHSLSRIPVENPTTNLGFAFCEEPAALQNLQNKLHSGLGCPSMPFAPSPKWGPPYSFVVRFLKNNVVNAESSDKNTPKENYCDKLRSHKKIYDVDIDFDEASKAWLQNKKKTEDGCYTYK